MARVEYGRHKRVATTADDSTSDIRPQRDWNGDAHAQTGLLGFDNNAVTLASDAFAPTSTCSVISAESSTSDNLATITNTNTQENDWVILFSAAGHTITVKHATGNIHVLGAADKVLSNTVVMAFFRRGANWYEYGGDAGGGTPDDNTVSGAKIAMGSDAAGDIIYYNGTDYARLAIGTAGQALKVNSGATAPEWGIAGGAHTTQDWTVQGSAPSNPSAGVAVMYTKTIDSNNEGLYIKMKKNGAVTEVQVA